MKRFERVMWALLLAVALTGGSSVSQANAQEDGMPVRYYIAPYGTGYVPRPNMRACKVILYMDSTSGHSAVHAYPTKDWCIAYVEGIEAVHTAIQADPQITLVPLWNDGGDYLPLSSTVADLSATSRANMASFLEAREVPMGWIVGADTLGGVIRHVVQILLTAQRLEDDYPEFDLDVQISTIPAAQRARILSWMGDNGIETSDIDLSWSVRQVLRRIVRDYGWSGVMELGTSLL